MNAPRNGRITNSATIFVVGDEQSIGCDDGFIPTDEISSVCTYDRNATLWEPDISSTECGMISCQFIISKTEV